MTVKKVRSMCIVCSEVFECEAQENQKALPVLLNNMWTIFMKYFYLTPSKWNDILKFYNEVFEIPFCLKCRNDIAELLIFHNKLQTLLEKIGRLRANISVTIVNSVANKQNSIKNDHDDDKNNNNNNISQIDNSQNKEETTADSQNQEDLSLNKTLDDTKCESTEETGQVEIKVNEEDDDVIEIKHEKVEKIPELVTIDDDDDGKIGAGNKSQIKSETPSSQNKEEKEIEEDPNIIYNKVVHDQIKDLREYIAQGYLPKIEIVDLKDEPDNIKSKDLDYGVLILSDDNNKKQAHSITSSSDDDDAGGRVRQNTKRKRIKRKGWNYGLKWTSVGVERFNGQIQRTWLYGDGKWPVIEIQGMENSIDDGFRCGTCDQVRQRKVDMARHILDCHSGSHQPKKLGSQQVFKCNFGGCNCSFNSRASLQVHQMRNHRHYEKKKRGRPFKYSSSQFNSSSSSSFVVVPAAPNNNNNNTCVVNPPQFVNSNILRTEINSANPEEEEEQEMEQDGIFNPVVNLKTEADLWTGAGTNLAVDNPWNSFTVVDNPLVSFSDGADAGSSSAVVVPGQTEGFLELGKKDVGELTDPLDEAEGIFHYAQWSYAQLEDEDTLRCLKCGGSEPSHEQMILHIQNTHEKELHQYTSSMLTGKEKDSIGVVEIEDGQVEEVVDKFVCEYPNCGKSYKTEGGLIYHAKLHSGFVVKCPVCDFCCSRDDSMRRHLFRHSDYVYTGGPFQLVRGNAVSRKYSTKTPDKGKRYQCPMCPKSYRHQTNLSSHKKTHRGNIDMRKIGRVENSMQRVKRKVLHRGGHGKRKFVCAICSASYTTLAGLQLHQKFHTGDVIECPEPNCTRVFSQKTNCEYHMRSFHGKNFRFPRIRELLALNRKQQEEEQVDPFVSGGQGQGHPVEEEEEEEVETFYDNEEKEEEEVEQILEDDVIVIS